jgi:hypothetical protein
MLHSAVTQVKRAPADPVFMITVSEQPSQASLCASIAEIAAMIADRTGLMTARLLIELGCHPLDAMNRVRAVRPGILGSAELVDYLRRVQPSRLEAGAPLEFLNRDGSAAVGLLQGRWLKRGTCPSTTR